MKVVQNSTYDIVACCLKAGLSEPRLIATQRLMIGHVPAKTKTASGRCVKTGIQQKRI
jgi:hypothetical protein